MYCCKICKLFLAALTISVLTIAYSCNSENTPDEAANTGAIDTTIVDTIQSVQVTYILPAPLQIASIFKKSGMKYSAGIAASAANAANLTNQFQKALGLGVYSADLAYFVTNKQTQEAINYMKVIRDISNDLGLSSVFGTESMMDRFERNISNEDSIAYILADVQMEMDALLAEGGQDYVSPIIFSGAWIESMYIGTKTYEKSKNNKLADKLGEQLLILNNLVKALQAHQSKNAGIPSLLNALTDIQQTFKGFAFMKDTGEDEIPENTAVTDEEIKALSAKIEAVRTKIINGNLQ